MKKKKRGTLGVKGSEDRPMTERKNEKHNSKGIEGENVAERKECSPACPYSNSAGCSTTRDTTPVRRQNFFEEAH